MLQTEGRTLCFGPRTLCEETAEQRGARFDQYGTPASHAPLQLWGTAVVLERRSLRHLCAAAGKSQTEIVPESAHVCETLRV